MVGDEAAECREALFDIATHPGLLGLGFLSSYNQYHGARSSKLLVNDGLLRGYCEPIHAPHSCVQQRPRVAEDKGGNLSSIDKGIVLFVASLPLPNLFRG